MRGVDGKVCRRTTTSLKRAWNKRAVFRRGPPSLALFHSHTRRPLVLGSRPRATGSRVRRDRRGPGRFPPPGLVAPRPSLRPPTAPNRPAREARPRPELGREGGGRAHGRGDALRHTPYRPQPTSRVSPQNYRRYNRYRITSLARSLLASPCRRVGGPTTITGLPPETRGGEFRGRRQPLTPGLGAKRY